MASGCSRLVLAHLSSSPQQAQLTLSSSGTVAPSQVAYRRKPPNNLLHYIICPRIWLIQIGPNLLLAVLAFVLPYGAMLWSTATVICEYVSQGKKPSFSATGNNQNGWGIHSCARHSVISDAKLCEMNQESKDSGTFTLGPK